MKSIEHIGYKQVKTYVCKYSWAKVQIFKNPELLKFKSYNLKLLNCAYKILTISNLNGQLSLDTENSNFLAIFHFRK